MSALTVALRDASFFRNPGTNGGRSYHVIVTRADGSRGPACGIIMHNEDTEQTTRGLLESEKCQRNGCRQRFEAES